MPTITEASPAPHNAALDSRLTAWFSNIADRVAEPLVEKIYGPIAEHNHTLGVVAVNGTLTAPRLFEIPLSGTYTRAVESDSAIKGGLSILAKTVLKGSDSLDGPVARKTGTTTVAGAIGDPLVDMAGIASDNVAIYKVARSRGDSFTANLAAVRSLLDIAVIGVSTGDYLLDAKLRKQGVNIPQEDEAKAGALGKLKYGLSAVGNPLTQSSFLAKEGSKTAKALKVTGNVLNLASLAAGAVSITQYSKRHKKKKKYLDSDH